MQTKNGDLLGFRVAGDCGRIWFVPIEAVGQDYADFLMEVDHLSPEEAKRQSDENRDFWPTWFAEQCQTWSDIECLGVPTKKDGKFKTKKALDRARGQLGGSIDDYEEVFSDPRTSGNQKKLNDLLVILQITQKRAAELIAIQTSRPCSIRTVRAWLADSSLSSARPCPDWAIQALQSQLEKKQ